MAKFTKTDETPAPRRPKISVLERRLQNPFGEPSAPVSFKEPGWTGRWFNAAKGADHIWRNLQKGWVKVRPDELSDIEQIGVYSTTPDGYVARGDRQQEMLMKMPTEWVEKIALAKVAKTNQMMRPGAQKQELMNAAAGALGDHNAELMGRAMVIGDVRTTREIVQRDEKAE